jgi:hypothetical protein
VTGVAVPPPFSICLLAKTKFFRVPRYLTSARFCRYLVALDAQSGVRLHGSRARTHLSQFLRAMHFWIFTNNSARITTGNTIRIPLRAKSQLRR